MTVTLEHYLILSVILFCIGVVGAVTRRNLLVMLMSIELMIAGANIALVAFARWNMAPQGQVAVVFALAIAAAGVAVGLAVIVAAFRNKAEIMADGFRLLKG